jgi:hypothetical protein
MSTTGIVIIMARVACAAAELEAMKIENKIRERSGQSYAYTDKDFLDIPKKYSIEEADVKSLIEGE